MDVLVKVFLLCSLATAQLSLSTPTGGVRCYGDQVTLVCTHPVLPQGSDYPQGDVSWRRDGTPISAVGLGRTTITLIIIVNSTTTRLQFTITEDTTGKYTCFLVNAVQGGIIESNSVSVRPLSESLQPT